MCPRNTSHLSIRSGEKNTRIEVHYLDGSNATFSEPFDEGLTILDLIGQRAVVSITFEADVKDLFRDIDILREAVLEVVEI